MIAVRVDLSSGFCISAVSEQGPAHEYVLKLIELFGSVVRGFAVFLFFFFFVERVGQRQLVLDCPMSEPLAPENVPSECASFDVFGSITSVDVV